MKKKFFKYVFLVFIVSISFWFYFQISTYPTKVARWIQPIESKMILARTKHCSPDQNWLNMFLSRAIEQGVYSAQIAFFDAKKKYHCEIGYKGAFGGEYVNENHRYRYASTTKLLTASIVSNLINKKIISVNDKLVKFFPEFGHFKDGRIRQVTIDHLLNHEAGFNRLTLNGDPMFLSGKKPWCPNDLSQLQLLTLAFNPGEKQLYSNVGYCLLGEIIHRVAGTSFRNYAETEFLLAGRNIKFVNNYFYDDEVRYDYRYEESYNNSYLQSFDFEAISSVAGLSGSATNLAQLLWDIHHKKTVSPFVLQPPSTRCDLKSVRGCLSGGVFHYQPEKDGIMLSFHEGYLPGSQSIAVVDSFGGITVFVASGANKDKNNPQNEWVPWIYKRLSFYYTLQGKLPKYGYSQ